MGTLDFGLWHLRSQALPGLKVWPSSLEVWPGSLKVWPSSLCARPSNSYGGSSKYGASRNSSKGAAHCGAAARVL